MKKQIILSTTFAAAILMSASAASADEALGAATVGETSSAPAVVASASVEESNEVVTTNTTEEKSTSEFIAEQKEAIATAEAEVATAQANFEAAKTVVEEKEAAVANLEAKKAAVEAEINASATPLDVEAIANGDYSSVKGEWINSKGEVITVNENPSSNFGQEINLEDVVSDVKISEDGVAVETSKYKLHLPNGEVSEDYYAPTTYLPARLFIPAGTQLNDSCYYLPEDFQFTASEDTILLYYMGADRYLLSDINDRFYTRIDVVASAEQQAKLEALDTAITVAKGELSEAQATLTVAIEALAIAEQKRDSIKENAIALTKVEIKKKEAQIADQEAVIASVETELANAKAELATLEAANSESAYVAVLAEHGANYPGLDGSGYGNLYTLRDLDGNGTRELLIASEEQRGDIVKAYSINENGELVTHKLVSAIVRASLHPLSDGTFLEIGSGGASLHGYTVFEYTADKGFNELFGYIDDTGVVTDNDTGKVVSSSVVKELTSMIISTDDWGWTSVSDTSKLNLLSDAEAQARIRELKETIIPQLEAKLADEKAKLDVLYAELATLKAFLAELTGEAAADEVAVNSQATYQVQPLAFNKANAQTSKASKAGEKTLPNTGDASGIVASLSGLLTLATAGFGMKKRRAN